MLKDMNPQHFKEILEKLELRNPRTVEVLRMVLAKCTDAEIAKSLGIHQGTVRKHIEKLYAAFGIKSKFEGDRRSKRGDLRERFDQYKPEWVRNYPSTVTNNVSNEQEQVNQNRVSVPVSLSTKESEVGEDLMALAITMLTQLGFDEMFKVSRSAQYIGYQLKNPDKGAKRYQLILAQDKEELSVSIIKGILDRYALRLQYWEYLDVAGQMYPFTIARFWILPSKKDVFLEFLHPYYWNLLKVEEKIMGVCYLNEVRCDNNGYEGLVIPRIPLEEV